MKRVKGKIEWEYIIKPNIQHAPLHLQHCIEENRVLLEELDKRLKKLEKKEII